MSVRGKIIRGAGGLLRRNTDLGVGIGPPYKGEEGEIKVRMVENQPRLYARAGGRWYSTPLYKNPIQGIMEDDDGSVNLGSSLDSGSHLKITGHLGLLDFRAGDENICIGNATNRPLESLIKADSSSKNIAIGDNVLSSATISNDTVAIGTNCLANVLEGNYNVAIGTETMTMNSGSNTEGSNNIAIGYYAMQDAHAGDSAGTVPVHNIAIGRNALLKVDGSRNIGLGFGSGDAMTTGSYNTFLGADTGGTVTTGSYNIFIGESTDTSTNTLSNQIGIGRSVQITGAYGIAIGDDIAAAANKFVIGKASNTVTVGFASIGTSYFCASDAVTGGSGSAGSGKQFVRMNINGTVYKVLHDGTV